MNNGLDDLVFAAASEPARARCARIMQARMLGWEFPMMAILSNMTDHTLRFRAVQP